MDPRKLSRHHADGLPGVCEGDIQLLESILKIRSMNFRRMECSMKCSRKILLAIFFVLKFYDGRDEATSSSIINYLLKPLTL